MGTACTRESTSREGDASNSSRRRRRRRRWGDAREGSADSDGAQDSSAEVAEEGSEGFQPFQSLAAKLRSQRRQERAAAFELLYCHPHSHSDVAGGDACSVATSACTTSACAIASAAPSAAATTTTTTQTPDVGSSCSRRSMTEGTMYELQRNRSRGTLSSVASVRSLAAMSEGGHWPTPRPPAAALSVPISNASAPPVEDLGMSSSATTTGTSQSSGGVASTAPPATTAFPAFALHVSIDVDEEPLGRDDGQKAAALILSPRSHTRARRRSSSSASASSSSSCSSGGNCHEVEVSDATAPLHYELPQLLQITEREHEVEEAKRKFVTFVAVAPEELDELERWSRVGSSTMIYSRMALAAPPGSPPLPPLPRPCASPRVSAPLSRELLPGTVPDPPLPPQQPVEEERCTLIPLEGSTTPPPTCSSCSEQVVALTRGPSSVNDEERPSCHLQAPRQQQQQQQKQMPLFGGSSSASLSAPCLRGSSPLYPPHAYTASASASASMNASSSVLAPRLRSIIAPAPKFAAAAAAAAGQPAFTTEASESSSGSPATLRGAASDPLPPRNIRPNPPGDSCNFTAVPRLFCPSPHGVDDSPLIPATLRPPPPPPPAVVVAGGSHSNATRDYPHQGSLSMSEMLLPPPEEVPPAHAAATAGASASLTDTAATTIAYDVDLHRSPQPAGMLKYDPSEGLNSHRSYQAVAFRQRVHRMTLLEAQAFHDKREEQRLRHMRAQRMFEIETLRAEREVSAGSADLGGSISDGDVAPTECCRPLNRSGATPSAVSTPPLPQTYPVVAGLRGAMYLRHVAGEGEELRGAAAAAVAAADDDEEAPPADDMMTSGGVDDEDLQWASPDAASACANEGA